jgi:hypothetical protein
MALRTLPFRQYVEQDVVNLYSLDSSVTIPGDAKTDGSNASGVLVTIQSGDFDAGISYDTSDTYVGALNQGFTGSQNGYARVDGMTVVPTTATSTSALGFTLNQTLSHDENGEKLLYYKQKAIELQAVLPGQVVPILTRGIITLSEDALTTGHAIDAGVPVFVAADGKIDDSGTVQIGTCIAKGTRAAGVGADQFAASGSESYYVIKFSL